MGRRSARFDEGAFVVEGPALISQAFLSGWEFEALFLAAGTHPEALDVPSGLAASNVSIYELAPNVMERVVSTETGPSLIATVRVRTAALASLDTASFVLVGDRINDPGNAGTMLRSAEAAGADAVVFTSGSVDVFNPKVVRASAGAVFVVPVVVDDPLSEVLRGTRQRSFGATSSAAAHHAIGYTQCDFIQPTMIVVGNEAHGLPPDAAVDHWVTIPHAGRAESLNVAMAAAVLSFEIARQRQAAPATFTLD